jgi:hypothetical protein
VLSEIEEGTYADAAFELRFQDFAAYAPGVYELDDFESSEPGDGEADVSANAYIIIEDSGLSLAFTGTATSSIDIATIIPGGEFNATLNLDVGEDTSEGVNGSITACHCDGLGSFSMPEGDFEPFDEDGGAPPDEGG